MGSSILTELTARKVNKLIGHLPLRLGYSGGDGAAGEVRVVAKVKPLDEEVVLMSNAVAQTCGGRLAATYREFRRRTGFAGCHVRELGVYEQADPRFTRHAPRVYGTHRDDAREVYVVVLERLDDLLLMNTGDDVSGWRPQHVEAALRGIAEVHGIWYGREDDLRQQPWLGPVQTAAGMAEMIPLWDALMAHAAMEFPALVTEEDLALLRGLLATLPGWWGDLERMPRTLIHNDFNPRNIGLRRGGLRLCAYDWELATLHLPQHDLAELLCYVLAADADPRAVDHYVDLHRRALMESAGCDIDPRAWRAGYGHALRDLCVNRLPLYLMGHTVRRYAFMQRVMGTALALLRAELARSGGGR